MRYCGVCGTDIAIHAGKHPRAKAPLVIGHEFVGVIEEVRAERVASNQAIESSPTRCCRAAFAYHAAPERRMFAKSSN